MAGKNVDIRINTTADTTGAKQATAAMQGLAASTQQAAAQSQAVTASAGKLGQTAGQIGLQLQDVAVQAQSGTSAVTILAQQGTQIASIFGPQGAIVGAIIGGLVSYPLAAAGAVLVGLIEAFASFWASGFKEVIVFTLILPILLVRSLRSGHSDEEH